MLEYADSSPRSLRSYEHSYNEIKVHKLNPKLPSSVGIMNEFQI